MRSPQGSAESGRARLNPHSSSADHDEEVKARATTIRDRASSTESPRVSSSEGAASTEPGSAPNHQHLKEKVAQQHTRRSSYGPNNPPPKWEGLEGVKLEDRIKGLSASASPLFSRRRDKRSSRQTGPEQTLGHSDSSGASANPVRLPPPPISAPPPRFLGFGSDAYGDADAAGAAAELLKNSVLLTISVPSLSTSVKLRFRATSSVDAAKQVLHRKLLKDELHIMSFWNPTTGIPLRPDRNLQDYLLKNEDCLVLAKEHASASGFAQTKIRVEVELTHLVEMVVCYKETTVLGVLQTMHRKGIPWEQTSLYALWRAKEGVWLDESKLIISYSLEQSETLVLKKRFASTTPETSLHTPDQVSQAQLEAADNLRKRFRTTSTASFVRVKNSQVNTDSSGEPPFDPSGAIIVVKFLCKNSDFITTLRVGTKDSTDTLRARIKKKLDDVHNYDIYLPSLVRMPESSCLEDHHIKERDQLELRKRLDSAAASHSGEHAPEGKKEEATPSRPTGKKKSEGGSSIRVFGSMRRKKERALTSSAPPFPMTLSTPLLAPSTAVSPATAAMTAALPTPVLATPGASSLKDDDMDKRKSKIWGRERDLLTSFFKNRPDKDELVAKKILVHPDGSIVIDDAAIGLNADVVSRTIEWLRQQQEFFELEGVFRISGTSTAVKQIWNRFRGPAEDIDFKEATSPHDVCGALKHYFRESPIPLIPFENHQDFVAAGQITDDRLCADALKVAVPNLPDEHKRMVRELFGFLHKGTPLIKSFPSSMKNDSRLAMMLTIFTITVMLYQDKNKMSANNLGIVFGPSIMRNRSNTVDFFSTGHQSTATYSMIQYYHYIFEGAEWQGKVAAHSSPRPPTPISAAPVSGLLAQTDEHKVLLAFVPLVNNKTDDGALLELARRLHTTSDNKLAEAMERELSGAQLVALCLGFARMIVDVAEKSSQQHNQAPSSPAKATEPLASATSLNVEEDPAPTKSKTEISGKKTSKRKTKKSDSRRPKADDDEEASKRRSGSWLALGGKK